MSCMDNGGGDKDCRRSMRTGQGRSPCAIRAGYFVEGEGDKYLENK